MWNFLQTMLTNCQTTKISMTTLLMIHRAASEDDNVTVDNALPSTSTATNDICPPPAKRLVTLVNLKWKKRRPLYSRCYPNCDVVKQRRDDLIKLLKRKNPCAEFWKVVWWVNSDAYYPTDCNLCNTEKRPPVFPVKWLCQKVYWHSSLHWVPRSSSKTVILVWR